MRPAVLLSCALALFLGMPGAARGQTLLRGNGDFVLGMSRAAVDSAIAARGLTVISGGRAFLVCTSDEEGAEYEQYAFLQAPHGLEFLWRVTVGYRLDATPALYSATRDRLLAALGAAASDSWRAGDDALDADGRPVTAAQHAVWADAFTAVQLGARWTDAFDRTSERMIVRWTDRRMQRTVEARRKRVKPPDTEPAPQSE